MATYDEIRQEHKEHLRKWPAIQQEVSQFIGIEPNRAYVYDFEAMKAAFDKQREWNEKLADIYRREGAAREEERRGS